MDSQNKPMSKWQLAALCSHSTGPAAAALLPRCLVAFGTMQPQEWGVHRFCSSITWSTKYRPKSLKVGGLLKRMFNNKHFPAPSPFQNYYAFCLFVFLHHLIKYDIIIRGM